MFILTCSCGNEIFGDEEDEVEAWQCEECGNWYDYFGYPTQPAGAPPKAALFKDYDPDFDREDAT